MTAAAALPETLSLTRETILSGALRRAAAEVPGMILADEAELAASIAATLACGPGSGDVWVFGYGSLLWNPVFTHAEHRTGRVAGWHRRFCLWTRLGRGCPEQPGLTLALARGGSCCGVAFRIPAAAVELELGLLWRREMLSGAYVPRWVTAATAAGPVRAIAFTINPADPRYAGSLDQAEIARIIACATGRIGPCSEYLFKTAAALQNFGIPDARLDQLCRRVAALIERQSQ